MPYGLISVSEVFQGTILRDYLHYRITWKLSMWYNSLVKKLAITQRKLKEDARKN